MNYLIFTDIHGSKKYLDLVMAKREKHNASKMIILGDFLYHGPRNPLPEGYDPKAVYETLNQEKNNILAILGNCDAAVDEYVLDFHLFKEIEKQIGKKVILFTHGDNLEEVCCDGLVVVGHYHVNKKEDNVLYLGSLSLPKDGHHTYAVACNDKLTVYDLLTDEILYEESLN